MSESPHRRVEILDAALACFIEHGVDGATIADIRKKAGATTGSLYHFFDGKDAILGALYLEILRDYLEELIARLRDHTSARALVRGMVEQYLGWVERRPDAARFLVEARRATAIATAEDEINAVTAAAFRELALRMKPWVDKGEIRRMPVDIYLSLLVGPAEVFTRSWLADKARTSMSRARTMLADAAWAAMRAED